MDRGAKVVLLTLFAKWTSGDAMEKKTLPLTCSDTVRSRAHIVEVGAKQLAWEDQCWHSWARMWTPRLRRGGLVAVWECRANSDSSSSTGCVCDRQCLCQQQLSLLCDAADQAVKGIRVLQWLSEEQPWMWPTPTHLAHSVFCSSVYRIKRLTLSCGALWHTGPVRLFWVRETRQSRQLYNALWR